MKSEKILKYPDASLITPCKEVEKIDDKVIAQIDKMLDLMYESRGVGLAANQVGYSNRVFVMDCSEDQEEPLCFINPVIREGRGESYEKEGCLSFPGVEVTVQRYSTVQISYLSINGERESRVFKDLEAICVQHEIDHLDGITFLERVNRKERRAINRKMRRLL